MAMLRYTGVFCLKNPTFRLSGDTEDFCGSQLKELIYNR